MNQVSLFDAEQEGGGSRLLDPGTPTPTPTAEVDPLDPVACRGCGTDLPAPKQLRKRIASTRRALRSASTQAAQDAEHRLQDLHLCARCRAIGVEAPGMVPETADPQPWADLPAITEAVAVTLGIDR